MPPPASVDSAMKRPVPCMSGHAGKQVAARLSARIAVSTSGGCGARPRHLPERHVQIVAAPHHGLRVAGRAAGVHEDQVVARRLARRSGARRALRRSRLRSRVRRRAASRVAGVRDLEQQARLAIGRQRRERVGDGRPRTRRGTRARPCRSCRAGTRARRRRSGSSRSPVPRRASARRRTPRGTRAVHAHDRDLVVGPDAGVAEHARQARRPGRRSSPKVSRRSPHTMATRSGRSSATVRHARANDRSVTRPALLSPAFACAGGAISGRR